MTAVSKLWLDEVTDGLAAFGDHNPDYPIISAIGEPPIPTVTGTY